MPERLVLPTFVSLFAGIGGFDRGLELAGWQGVGQVEIDGFCNRILEKHWPTVPRWGDIRTVAGSDLPAVDLLCGGFPCQDVSKAGRRAGLAGARSGLFWDFVRLAGAVQPRWLLLENVFGLLSSHRGHDFAAILAALGAAGYGLGWRVLDSRWFGVPQRRRRVFLIGHLGGPCPPEVLDQAGDGGEHSGPLGRAGEAAAAGPGSGPALGSGAGAGGVLTPWDNQSRRVHSPAGTVPALQHRAGDVARGHESIRILTDEPDDDDAREDPTSVPLYYSTDFNQDRIYSAEGIIPAICAQEVSGSRRFLRAGQVRRLTPLECERLQGFPDGYTCLCGVAPYNTWDCTCPDGPRYATLGNAVTVPVAHYLGLRLLAAHRAEALARTAEGLAG